MKGSLVKKLLNAIDIFAPSGQIKDEQLLSDCSEK